MDNDHSHKTSHLCGICNKSIKDANMHVYPCETCFDWMHARCLFPSVTEEELRILFKFSHAFQVKCRPCRKLFFETVRTATKTHVTDVDKKSINASKKQKVDIAKKSKGIKKFSIKNNKSKK